MTWKEKQKTQANKPAYLLSTDTLSGYGLDLIFQVASDMGYDGIDLAMRKNFDARHISYVQDLMQKYNLPIKVVQISRKVNIKEMNQAVDLAKSVGANVITINSPDIFNVKSYRFLTKHLPSYKQHNKDLKFSIINPKDASIMGVIPRYYFSNMVQIIKKYSMYLGLDIVNVEEEILEDQFMRKMANFIPYLSVVYLSDVDKHGRTHLPLGDGELKLPLLLKKFKQLEYFGYFSLKLELDKADLADIDRIELILKKCRMHYKEYFEEVLLS